MSREDSGCGPLIAPLTDANRSLRQQIFERVRAAGQISRIDVSKALNVSPASVTTATSELIEEGLLSEIAIDRPAGDTARGRPPVGLAVRAEAYHVAGLKLSDRDFSAVVADFTGTVLASEQLPASPHGYDLETLLALSEDLLDKVTRQAGLTRRDLAAVGIGLPGFVDHEKGLAIWSPVLTRRDVALAPAAAARFGVPVVIDNDANLVTLAELWFGVGRTIADFAVVTIEHGVGMGLVSGHKLMRGGNGLGTELGHTKVQIDGALCRCGQRGCLEAYVADYALAREAMTALRLGAEEQANMALLLERLFDQAKAGNTGARTIFRRAGRYLAVGLANVANLFDPSLIILSGERMRYDYLYADEVLDEMKDLALNTGRALPPVKVHAWGDLLWAQGAAALALSFLADDVLATRREAAQ